MELNNKETALSKVRFWVTHIKAYYRFSHKEKTLCEFTTDKASFEFEYY